MKDKNQLRKWAKEIRSNLDMKFLSEKLAEKLRQTDEYKNSKNVMIFYPLENEVDLLSLLEDKSKTFYLPKIEGEELLCCKYDSDTELCESCFRTKEPVSGEVESTVLDLIIVPALACDKNNYRLGYGKGFYDRFLGVNSKAKSIVCIPRELLVETVYPNEFDIPVDKVITE